MAKRDRITLKDAARLVAECVYSSAGRKADDKARKAISYAVRKREIARSLRRDFSRKEFLWWADKKWPGFRERVPIPPRPMEISAAQITLQGQNIDMVIMPSSVEELRRMYLQERKLRLACNAELTAARRELETARAEAAARREKTRAIAAKRSAAGRKGGRGRTL